VFALSAQKALAARITNDAALRRRSGIEELEHQLAHQVIPGRRDILCHAVKQNVTTMLDESLLGLDTRVQRSTGELLQLTELSGKNRELVENARSQLQTEKLAYEATAEQFKHTRRDLQKQGELLLAQLSDDALDRILRDARAALEGSWTTRGLTSGIFALSEQMTARFRQAAAHADSLLDSLAQAYSRFHREHGLPKMDVPRLDLAAYQNRLTSLIRETDAFCRDPANLMLEKRFMIRRFYAGLVDQAKQAFALARTESERWLRIALDPVMTRIREHKLDLDARLASLKKILENMGTLHNRMSQIKTEIGAMRAERQALDLIRERLSG
jgi:hypothetical protein